MSDSRCDGCGCKLERGGTTRGDLIVCGVCKKRYDDRGYHLPSKPPVPKIDKR